MSFLPQRAACQRQLLDTIGGFIGSLQNAYAKCNICCIPRDSVQDAIDNLIGNPYRPGADTAASGRTLARVDLPRALAGLLDEGDVGRAEALVLAAGHHQAIAGEGEVLGRATFPEPLRRRL